MMTKRWWGVIGVDVIFLSVALLCNATAGDRMIYESKNRAYGQFQNRFLVSQNPAHGVQGLPRTDTGESSFF